MPTRGNAMLKTFFAAMFSSLLALLSSASFAAGALMLHRLGMEVGAATIGQVKSAFSGKTKLQDAGQNKFTEGKMIQADGAGFDIEGIQNVLFIFDKSDVLVGVILAMNKDPKVYTKHFHLNTKRFPIKLTTT